jgi:hypothetical protein
VPRRMACRVIIPKKISTIFSKDPELGMKCSVIRGLRASQPRPAGCLWVTYLSTPREGRRGRRAARRRGVSVVVRQVLVVLVVLEQVGE